MAQQRPLDHDAFSGVDDSVYQSNSAFNAFDNNFAYPGDQYSNNDAGWGLNASTLHNPQALSRAPSRSPAWPNQQQHQQQQHLIVRPLSAGPSPNEVLRHSPLPGTPYAPPPTAYNAFQQQSAYPYQQQQQQQQPQPQQQQYDPSLLGATTRGVHQPFPTYDNHAADAQTIAPQSLQHEVALNSNVSAFPTKNASASKTNLSAPYNTGAGLVDQIALVSTVPKSEPAGLFSLIDFDRLVRATNSERMGNYANVGREPQEWAINRAALPAYVPRSSRNALKRAAGNDPTLLAKISGSRKSRSKLNASRSRASRPGQSGRPGVKGELADLASDDSDDSSDSEHTTDDELDDSPLPPKRPETLREAIEYDTIEALWRSKRRAVDANDVRKALVAFWEVVKTVRDRWKADTAAVSQAEEKGAKGELPFLRQRVKDQRDLIEIAFKTALKHGNRTIIETLSENTPLIFLCYQFLLDRHKAEDINGSLARAILEVMSLFTTLTEEKLEKTHLVKVLPRIIKAGDAKTQFYAKQITNKAAANKTLSDKSATPVVGKDLDTKAPSVASATTKTDTAAGVKRPGGTLNGTTAVKKAAVGPAKLTSSKSAAESTTSTAKKRLMGNDAAKPAAKKIVTTNGTADTKNTSSTAAKPKPASKLTSGLFAGLQSAAKKPGTSVKGATTGNAASAVKDAVAKPASVPAPAPSRPAFSLADAMKSVSKPKEEKQAPEEKKEIIKETPAEKARRLRREARGPLRVHWKAGEDLVAVREFTHDPEEDMGHDSSQTRDVTDLQGEGRMFKQQHNSMMDLDEEDEDAVTPAKAVKMVGWSEPQLTDFSDVDDAERKRNYSRFADGELKPSSPETAEREKYEATTLMVFYSQPEDIPPNPREPVQSITGDGPAQITSFGAPDQKFLDRAKQVRTLQQNVANGMSSHAAPQAPIDFDKLRNMLSQGNQPVQPVVQPSPAAPDIMSILAKISQGNMALQQSQPQAQFDAPNPAWAGIIPPTAQVPQPQAQPDISAILAQLKGTQQPQPPPPMPVPPMPMPGFSTAAMDPGFLAFVAQQQAAQAQAQQQQNGVDGDGRNAYKTKVCKYHQEGKCLKGDKCTYIHE